MTTPRSEAHPEELSLDVRQGLARLYRLRMWLWGLWLAVFPFMVIAVAVQPPAWLLKPLGTIWFGTWVVLALVHGFYRCPACRHFFHLRSMYGNAFTSKCLHCGISIHERERRV